jgi:flagellar hook-associated protein 2
VSSPITLSGFNNIDFSVVLNAIMAQASQPLTVLQSRQSDLKAQISSFNNLSAKIAAINQAATALQQAGPLAMVSGSSTDSSAVAVSAGPSALAGHYDVVVNELARSQVTVSSSFAPDATTTVVANSGALTINGVAVAIAADSTLQQLADAINATSGVGVSASVMRTAAGAYRLALTATANGAAGAFTVTNTLTGGTGVTFVDTDGDNISGDDAADNAVSATDASILFNNVTITSDTNTIADIVPGVTLTLLRKNPAATVGVDVSADTTALSDALKAFATAYNDLHKFVNEQRTAANTGKTSSLGRDPILRQLASGLRSAMLAPYGSGALTRLPEVGLEFTRTGELQLNSKVFAAAASAQPAAVRALIGGTTGALASIGSLLSAYTQASGFVPEGQRRLEQQVAAMGAQVDALQRRLALQREALQRQFTEADTAMARLKSQAGALSGFATSLGDLL